MHHRAPIHSFMLIIVFLASSCVSSDRDEVCVYEGPVVNNGKNYGVIALKDAENKWLSFCPVAPDKDTVTYSNSHGVKADYYVSNFVSYQRISLRKIRDGTAPCGGPIYKEDYCTYPLENVRYSRSKDFGLEIYHNVNIGASINGKDILTVTDDEETLSGNAAFLDGSSYYGEIYTDTTISNSIQTFHNIFTPRNKTYYSVFEIKDTSSQKNGFYNGYYFSFKEGLVGYYLNNGEVWLKEN